MLTVIDNFFFPERVSSLRWHVGSKACTNVHKTIQMFVPCIWKLVFMILFDHAIIHMVLLYGVQHIAVFLLALELNWLFSFHIFRWALFLVLLSMLLCIYVCFGYAVGKREIVRKSNACIKDELLSMDLFFSGIY